MYEKRNVQYRFIHTTHKRKTAPQRHLWRVVQQRGTILTIAVVVNGIMFEWRQAGLCWCSPCPLAGAFHPRWSHCESSPSCKFHNKSAALFVCCFVYGLFYVNKDCHCSRTQSQTACPYKCWETKRITWRQQCETVTECGTRNVWVVDTWQTFIWMILTLMTKF